MSRSLKLCVLFGLSVISLWLSGCGPASTTSRQDADEEGDATEISASGNHQNSSDVQRGSDGLHDELRSSARGSGERQDRDKVLERPQVFGGDHENRTATHLSRNQGNRHGRYDDDDKDDDDHERSDETQLRVNVNGNRSDETGTRDHRRHAARDTDRVENNETQGSRNGGNRQGRHDDDDDDDDDDNDRDRSDETQFRGNINGNGSDDTEAGHRRRRAARATARVDNNQTQGSRNRGNRQGRQDDDDDDDDSRDSNDDDDDDDDNEENQGRRRRNGNINGTGENRGRRRAPASSTWPTADTPGQEAVLVAARAVSRIFSDADDQGSMLADIVRLSFHDAGTFDPATNTGGADGCVDLAAPENNGLEPIIDVLSVVVSAGNLSRADVWALAANMAIEAAGGPKMEFQTGRIDSSSCGGHGERLPNAELGHSHILEVMVTKLDFSERETAALMGAHVLGQATRSISGYEGAWVPRNARFSNQYFEDLIGRPWNREVQPPFEGQTRSQWNGRGGTMMLNTDIELAFDTSNGCTRAGGGGGGQVRGSRCPRAVSAFNDAVTEFAQRGGEQVFFETFRVAFMKLLALGSDGLTCPFPDCITPGSS